MDQIRIPAEPPASDRERQGSYPDEHHQLGERHVHTPLQRTTIRGLSDLLMSYCPSGPAVWRQQLPDSTKLGGLRSCVCCCAARVQSYAHHKRQTTPGLLLPFCLILQAVISAHYVYMTFAGTCFLINEISLFLYFVFCCALTLFTSAPEDFHFFNFDVNVILRTS